MDHPDNLEQSEEVLELQDRCDELEKRVAGHDTAMRDLQLTGRVLGTLLDLFEENRTQMRQIDQLNAVARQLMAQQNGGRAPSGEGD